MTHYNIGGIVGIKGISIIQPPKMKTKELRVDTTLGTDDLTPTSGKKITVHAIQGSQFIPSAISATLRATIAFGSDHTANSNKVLASCRTVAKDSSSCICMTDINVTGEINEIVRLTNTTFSSGICITRCVLYYSEK